MPIRSPFHSVVQFEIKWFGVLNPQNDIAETHNMEQMPQYKVLIAKKAITEVPVFNGYSPLLYKLIKYALIITPMATPVATDAEASMVSNSDLSNILHTSQKENIFAANDPIQTPGMALRPIINTAASANPTSGKIGDKLSGETVILKLKKASTLKTNATRITLNKVDFKKKGVW